jgi:hypothetical protein
MEFRRSVNRMLSTETASGTADAVIAASQDTMSRQEKLNQWKEERVGKTAYTFIKQSSYYILHDFRIVMC